MAPRQQTPDLARTVKDGEIVPGAFRDTVPGDGTAGEPVASAVRGGSSTVEEAPCSRAHIFRSGELIDGIYEIRSVIGSGGMGQVFEAEDRALRRKVAIKAAWPEVDASYLRREAQVMAAVHHPGLPAVHALGRWRDCDYVVMERIYGLSLRAHLLQRQRRGEPFRSDEVVDILIGIADVLASIHRAGVAHRDLKPANLMLAPGNRIVLLDFGLAVAEFEAGKGTLVVGSPSYMAPEAIRADVASGSAHLLDLYALGIIAWELLTGCPPFDSQDIAETFRQHITSPVPELTPSRPDVPRALVDIVRELLSKDPGDRTPNSDHVAWQLRQVRTPSPTAATSRPFSVLVVDDDEDLQRVLQFYVRIAVPDARIRSALDGEKALEAVGEDPPDLMLLDLSMPRMNGIEVCMLLRGTHRADGCTIVSVSAAAQEHDVDLLRSLGIVHFVPKGPGLSDKLVAVIRKVHGSR
ncbi:MAG: protein kinase [Deltaproteobacteria bacterium]|nr:protein kinase [Deltaproteobacteria bacterium]